MILKFKCIVSKSGDQFSNLNRSNHSNVHINSLHCSSIIQCVHIIPEPRIKSLKSKAETEIVDSGLLKVLQLFF